MYMLTRAYIWVYVYSYINKYKCVSKDRNGKKYEKDILDIYRKICIPKYF